jgi:hypothetical protein
MKVWLLVPSLLFVTNCATYEATRPKVSAAMKLVCAEWPKVEAAMDKAEEMLAPATAVSETP